MKDSRGIVKFFDRGYILRYLLSVMLISLMLPAEVLAFMFFQKYMSLYVLIAISSFASVLFLPLSYWHITFYIKKIRRLIYSGEFPDIDFSLLAGAFAGGIFLAIPGIVTKVLGIFLFFALPKRLLGMVILSAYGNVKKDLYEYLKLYSA